MIEWMVQIRRFDILFYVTSLIIFSADTREVHLNCQVNIFGYVQDNTGRRKSIVISPEDIREISVKAYNTAYWLDNYPDVTEEIDEGLPDPRGRPLSTTVYFDSNHAYDQVM